jgi:hypothetical protein
VYHAVTLTRLKLIKKINFRLAFQMPFSSTVLPARTVSGNFARWQSIKSEFERLSAVDTSKGDKLRV